MSGDSSPGATTTAPAPSAPATGGSAPAGANVGAGDGPTPSLAQITVEPAGEGHVNIGPGTSQADSAPATTPTKGRETVTTTSRASKDAQAATDGDGTGKAEPAQGKTGGDWKVEDLPDGAQRHIKELRDESAKGRKATQEANAKAADLETKLNGFIDGFSKVLGLTEDGQQQAAPDPEKLAAQLDEMAAGQREQAVRLAVWEKGHEHGANIPELMDSAAFLGDLKKLDPAGQDFPTELGRVITAAVERNPARFKAQPVQAAATPPVPSCGDFTGGTGGRSNTDIESMSVDDFRKLRETSRPL
jgi:hypothetical protein